MIDRYPLDLTNKRYAILYIRKGLYFEGCKNVNYISDHLLKSKDFSSFLVKVDNRPETYMSLTTQRTIVENAYIMRTLLKDLNTNKYELGI